MSNATAAAPVRAHKATSNAKAASITPARSADAPPKRVVSEASRAASNAAGFASVLMSQIVELDDLSFFGRAGDLFIQAGSFIAALAYGDEADQPINVGNDEVRRAIAMLESALETMEASADTSPLGTALLIATLAHEALDVLRRISAALEVSPATLVPLKELDTYAGVRPRREQPRSAIHHASANAPGLAASMSAVAQHRTAQPTPLPPVVPAAPSTATKRQRHPTELLMDQLQIGATISTMLFMNFGGDGSFDPPHAAPGVNGMVGALATAAACARRLASEQGLAGLPQIAHAAALAEHMEMLSNEKLMDGSRGFRQDDQFLGMSFWCIKTMFESAYHEVEQL